MFSNVFKCKQLRMISDCCAARGLTKSFPTDRVASKKSEKSKKIPPIFLLSGFVFFVAQVDFQNKIKNKTSTTPAINQLIIAM